jgi:hypothetical protein
MGGSLGSDPDDQRPEARRRLASQPRKRKAGDGGIQPSCWAVPMLSRLAPVLDHLTVAHPVWVVAKRRPVGGITDWTAPPAYITMSRNG